MPLKTANLSLFSEKDERRRSLCFMRWKPSGSFQSSQIIRFFTLSNSGVPGIGYGKVKDR